MPTKRIRRRRYLIDRDLQGRYVFHLFLIAFAGSLLLSGLLAFATGDTFTIIYENSFLHLGRTREVLLDRFLAAFWFLLVFGGGMTILAAVVLSHRFAGPLQKIGGALAAMTEGNLATRINLRNGDEGKEAANRLNALAARLLLEFQAMDAAIAEAEKLLEMPDDGAGASGGKNSRSSAQKRLHEVRERLQRFLPKGI